MEKEIAGLKFLLVALKWSQCVLCAMICIVAENVILQKKCMSNSVCMVDAVNFAWHGWKKAAEF